MKYRRDKSYKIHSGNKEMQCYIMRQSDVTLRD